jgi:hypothetical protein
LKAKKLTREKAVSDSSREEADRKGGKQMSRPKGWRILAALFILFALNSQAGAAGIVNLNPGAVYQFREFDRHGKSGEKHLPSAFWWGEEARKKAEEKMARVNWSIDPPSGKLVSVSIAGQTVVVNQAGSLSPPPQRLPPRTKLRSSRPPRQPPPPAPIRSNRN